VLYNMFMISTSAFYRDSNFVPIRNLGIITKRTITFAGATADAWGNDGGALDGGAIFTVTGAVKMQMFGLCSTNLVGGATLETGIAGATAILNAQTTDTDIDADEFWFNSATPAAYFDIGAEIDATGKLPLYILNGQDVIMTVSGGNDTDSGVIDFFAIWNPLSEDGNLVATTD